MNPAAVCVVAINESHIPSFHAALDAVCRERLYLAMLQAPPLEAVRDFVLNNLRNGNPQFVALEGGQVVGWCDVRRMDQGAFAHVGILGMGVIASHRGHGLGRKLIETTLAAADQRGFERVELAVYASNDRARRLYETTGFLHEGIKRRARKLDGKYDDALMMARLR